MTELNLHDKLVVAAGEAGYVQKGSQHAQGYAYADDEAITVRFRNAMLKQGILVYPTRLEVLSSVVIERNGKDVPNVLVTLVGDFTVTDGKTSFTTSGVGQGIDIGDKGVPKALTGLKKYVYRFLVMMATGDDPEIAREDEVGGTIAAPNISTSGTKAKADPKPTADKTATKAQRDKVFAKGNEAGLTKDEMKALRERVTDKPSSTQFTNKDIDAMLAAIEEAGKAKAATGGEIV